MIKIFPVVFFLMQPIPGPPGMKGEPGPNVSVEHDFTAATSYYSGSSLFGFRVCGCGLNMAVP